MLVYAKVEIVHTDADRKTNVFKRGTPFRIEDRDEYIVRVVDAWGHKINMPSDRFDETFASALVGA
jgi:hypothetical protein